MVHHFRTGQLAHCCLAQRHLELGCSAVHSGGSSPLLALVVPFVVSFNVHTVSNSRSFVFVIMKNLCLQSTRAISQGNKCNLNCQLIENTHFLRLVTFGGKTNKEFGLNKWCN